MGLHGEDEQIGLPLEPLGVLTGGLDLNGGLQVCITALALSLHGL